MRLTPKGRDAVVRSVVEDGVSKADGPYRFNTTPTTVARWVEWCRKEDVESILLRIPNK